MHSPGMRTVIVFELVWIPVPVLSSSEFRFYSLPLNLVLVSVHKIFSDLFLIILALVSNPILAQK